MHNSSSGQAGESNGEEARRPYIVVLKGSSSVRFPNGSSTHLRLNTPIGPAEAFITTNWQDLGLKHPVPRELWFEVRLPHRSIDEAIEAARAIVVGLVPIMSYATNAEIGQVEPHLAYDNSQGVDRREFIEYFLPDESGLLSPTRQTDPSLIGKVVDAFSASPYGPRLGTALAHYHSALSNYFLGGESLAVGHLFMAAEALREPALIAYCASTGMSEENIMRSEGHDNRDHLLAWARRNIIFAGDLQTHRAVKAISDAFEHGYKTVGEVRAVSSTVCDRAFELLRGSRVPVTRREGASAAPWAARPPRCRPKARASLRRAITDLLDLDERARERLLTDFATPADTKSLRKRIRGRLIGEAEDLAAPDRAYPILEWRSRISHFEIGQDGQPDAQFTEMVTPRIAVGVGFQPERVEFFGRSSKGRVLEPIPVTIEQSSPDDTQLKDKVLPILQEIGRGVGGLGPGAKGAQFSRPQAFLLELFNRAKGLFKGCSALLEQGLPEEALIVGQSLFSDAMRLKQASESSEEQRIALAFGWKRDSLEVRKRLVRQTDLSPTELAEGLAQLDAQQEELRSSSRALGAGELMTFQDVSIVAAHLDEEDLPNIHGLAQEMAAGSDIATQSRLRQGSASGMGLHDTAPNSWVLPMAMKYIGASYLLVAEAALEIFDWPDTMNIGEKRSTLETVVDELSDRAQVAR
jgi:hypothetical protein